ncbi:MAG: uracil-DNA glycosylase family protein [Bacteroidota bacterium]
MSFAQKVLDFHFQTLQPNWKLPAGVELLFPFHHPDTQACMRTFYEKYLNDDRKRIFVFGINPGRFGAGVTGVPFTGPKMLREECGIEHPFTSRPEMSAEYIWKWINAMGGPEAFFQDFYITSVCPLGFTKAGKNYNYYDSKKLEKAVLPHIIANFNTQLPFGSKRDYALCLGEGKNFKFFQTLNAKHDWFGEVLPLAHPRFVMQYKRKSLDDYLERYVQASEKALNG